MTSLAGRALTAGRRAFYRSHGPWYRARLFEALGSHRYSRPALFEMDLKLAELCPDGGGVFLEAGAHDGYTQSNTYYLERHCGWSGVLVEPVPELFRRCVRRRPGSMVFNCALVGPEEADASVAVQFGDLQSTVGDDGRHAAGGLKTAGRRGYEVSVPARALAEVIAAAGVGEIDVAVLDLEGRELEALRGLDYDGPLPRHLLIEMLDMQAMRPAFDDLLAGAYVFEKKLSEYDALYARC